MKRVFLLFISVMLAATASFAQKRYVDEVFSDSQVYVQQDVIYATNIDFLTSTFTNALKVQDDLTVLKTNAATGQTHDPKYYNPLDTNSVVKVVDLKMDLYSPHFSADSTESRPLVIYIHTGNFLPVPVNQSTVGDKRDSCVIDACRSLAKRGYVVAAIDYRYGWNPLGTTVWDRRGTLLNAVYRVIHDTKMAVRYVRKSVDNGNPYGVNPDQVILLGEGSGAYVSNAYVTMDKFSELELPKFINPSTGKSIIDTLRVGNLEGYGGLLNLYLPTGYSAEVQASVALGGALADTSWLEAGDPPMMAVQCVRGPFAPFDGGIVVVPTTGEDVVEVQGSNLYIKKANELGNNDELNSSTYIDPYSQAARSRYGVTYDYIYPTQPKMTVTANCENLFPMIRPLGATTFQNEEAPWQWWDPSHVNHSKGIVSNPDMSPEKGRIYVDTILNYICPRISDLFGYTTSVREMKLLTGLHVYPNPANNDFSISLERGIIETVVLVDITGREVMRLENVDSEYVNLSISDLNSGLYFVRVLTADGQGTVSLIKD